MIVMIAMIIMFTAMPAEHDPVNYHASCPGALRPGRQPLPL